MEILLTSHHGYIGAVTGPLLRAGGHEVTGLDTFFYEGCDLLENGDAVDTELRRRRAANVP
jgi:nucleoside-diphosphate-sugar epimerase